MSHHCDGQQQQLAVVESAPPSSSSSPPPVVAAAVPQVDGGTLIGQIIRDSVAEGVAAGVRASVSPAPPATIVVNNSAVAPEKRHRKESKRKVGNEFTLCVHCKESVVFAINPEVCAEPYLVCSKDCTADRPKALHLKCAYSILDNEENVGRIFEAECDTCRQKVEIDCTADNVNVIANVVFSKTTYFVLVLLIAFALSGYVWKAVAFHYVVAHWAPTDALNNPALIYFNKTSHREELRRPVWRLDDFLAYNHCVITDYGSRVLLRRLAAMEGQTPKRSSSKFNINEEFAALYALLNDMTAAEGDEPDVTKYFSPCGRSGLLWPGMAHWQLCFHTFRWPFALIIFSYILYRVDSFMNDGRVVRWLRRSRMARVIRVGGEVYKPSKHNMAERMAKMRRTSFGFASVTRNGFGK